MQLEVGPTTVQEDQCTMLRRNYDEESRTQLEWSYQRKTVAGSLGMVGIQS